MHLRHFGETTTDQMPETMLASIGENAGVIDIGGGCAVTFKVESHNHPSYVEPYQPTPPPTRRPWWRSWHREWDEQIRATLITCYTDLRGVAVTNLTLSIDDDLLQRARMRALESRTSVNALVRDFLESYVGNDPAARAMTEFLAITDTVRAGGGADGRTWTRDDLHGR